MSADATDTPSLATIAGSVRDAATGAPLPAWVRITASDGTVAGDWAVDDSLRGFPCDGSFTVEVPAGPVRVEVHRLLSHEWAADEFVAEPGQICERTYQLRPWIDLHGLGYFCGESHNHINHPTPPEDVVLYCRALGLDYVNVCQGWMHARDENARTSGRQMAEALERHSTEDFALHFGAERPKTRYGHVWWWNLAPFERPFGEYDGWHDSNYFAVSGSITEDVADIRARFPFHNELPFKTWKRYRDRGAACAIAHPTSWWTDNDDATLIATNIAAELPFALLAGDLVDAMVVMGYDPEQVFYQNTWFHVLNEGYDLPAVAETDGSLRGRHHIGQLLGYVRTPDGRYSQAGIIEGVRRGRVVVSSGPFVTLTADDGAHQTGDHVPAGGEPHELLVRAWSSPKPDEFISYVVIFRNGEIFRKIDLTAERARRWETSIAVTEHDERAWYVAKVYGSTWPREDVFFDVMEYCRLCEREPHFEYAREIREVAFTNPIYFVPVGWARPKPVTCDCTLRVVTGAAVRVLNYDEELATYVADGSGVVRCEMPPTAEVEVSAPGRRTVRKSIFLDYDPVNDCLEYCYSGRWRSETPSPLKPGQVPWRFFRFRELRAALGTIDWTIDLPPA